MLLEIVTPTHEATQRDYLARVHKDKPDDMDRAMLFEEDYWHDSEGRYGYKAHRFIPGYWKPVAKKLIAHYGLDQLDHGHEVKSYRPPRILDVGCGKGFLLSEIGALLPAAELVGFDISKTAVACATPGINVFRYDASKPFPFDDGYFDLVISLGCLHNLRNYERESAIKEIERVGQRKYIMVESYRNNRELCHLQWWAMTCVVFQRPDEWSYEYRRLGYRGDSEYIYFR